MPGCASIIGPGSRVQGPGSRAAQHAITSFARISVTPRSRRSSWLLTLPLVLCSFRHAANERKGYKGDSAKDMQKAKALAQRIAAA
jgi:hypothetical protein